MGVKIKLMRSLASITRATVFLGGLSFLSGCVTAQTRNASELEPTAAFLADVKAARDAADRAWLSCATPRLLDLDDGTSDPQTIAIGARAGCEPQFKGVAFAYIPSGVHISDFFPTIEKSLDEVSVKLVLELRAKRRHHQETAWDEADWRSGQL